MSGQNHLIGRSSQHIGSNLMIPKAIGAVKSQLWLSGLGAAPEELLAALWLHLKPLNNIG